MVDVGHGQVMQFAIGKLLACQNFRAVLDLIRIFKWKGQVVYQTSGKYQSLATSNLQRKRRSIPFLMVQFSRLVDGF